LEVISRQLPGQTKTPGNEGGPFLLSWLHQCTTVPGNYLALTYHTFRPDGLQVGYNQYIGIPARRDAAEDIIEGEMGCRVYRDSLNSFDRLKTIAYGLLQDIIDVALLQKCLRRCSIADERKQSQVNAVVLDPGYGG